MTSGAFSSGMRFFPKVGSPPAQTMVGPSLMVTNGERERLGLLEQSRMSPGKFPKDQGGHGLHRGTPPS